MPYPTLDRNEVTYLEVDTQAMVITLPNLNVNFNRIMGAAVSRSYQDGLRGAPCYSLVWRGQAVGTLQLRELGENLQALPQAAHRPAAKRPMADLLSHLELED